MLIAPTTTDHSAITIHITGCNAHGPRVGLGVEENLIEVCAVALVQVHDGKEHVAVSDDKVSSDVLVEASDSNIDRGLVDVGHQEDRPR